MSDETCSSDTEHQHDVGEEFEDPHKGRWEVTNRMVDVDTGEVLYRLRALETDFNESEILTEGQMRRIYDDERELQPATDRPVSQSENSTRTEGGDQP